MHPNFPHIPLALTFDDVLLIPQASRIHSRSEVTLKTHLTPKIQIDFPVISINMDSVTGYEMAVAMYKYGGMSFYPRFLAPVEQVKEVQKVLKAGAKTIPAVGIKDTDFERVRLFANTDVEAITIDIAHGHLQSCQDFIKKIKKEFSHLEVIAGVIGTYEGARDLFEAGADAVRVGVGPGTICTTRKVTGAGVPQITATLDAFQAGKEYGRPVITDGGMKTSGDIMKALGAGANAVTLGSFLAGTDETPGEVFEKEGKKYKQYNASTSKTEKNRQVKKYSKDKNASYTKFVEGVESLVPAKGPVAGVLGQIENGVRSGMSYCNALTIDELHQNARFMQVTSSSIAENGSHGVITD